MATLLLSFLKMLKFCCIFFFLGYLLSFPSKDQKFAIVSFFSGGYLDIFNNFHKNLKNLSLDKYLHVYVIDSSNLDYLIENNISYYILNSRFLTNDSSETYGTYNWNKLNLIKGSIFVNVLNQYDEFVYSDPDVIWLKSNVHMLQQMCKRDICFQSDSIWSDTNNGSFNAGFFYAKKSKLSTKIFLEWKNKCEQGDGRLDDDQTILNKLIVRKNYSNIIQRFDRKYVANGKYQNWFENCANLSSTDIITLHNNWVRGREAKIQRAKNCGYWY